MENLIFSLNATIPIFLMMVLGVFFRKTGLLKENMINGLNQFVFKATLPVLLFGDLAKQDFAEAWNGKFVAFCFVVTLVNPSAGNSFRVHTAAVRRSLALRLSRISMAIPAWHR